MSRIATAPDPLLSFHGPIQARSVPFHYRLGLTLIAVAMLLLPAIYIGLIVCAGWLVWWHIRHDWGMITAVGKGRAMVLALVLYVGLAAAGLTMMFFMIKPLFSRRARPRNAITVGAQDQPELIAFIHKICDLIGAPHPREVRLDCDTNASAGFCHGLTSAIFGGDLVLVIGMPLVAGLTMRQFAGVLAHEFGHFAQGAGMRLSFVIRSINAWFARVVFERDEWDERLIAWRQADHWSMELCAVFAQVAVGTGRKILHALMLAGHALSSFMSRQMEFDADSYEAQVAGSSEFPRTAERLRLLSVARQIALRDAFQSMQSRQLPDDLPAMIVWREKGMDSAHRSRVQELFAQAKTGWGDTHPSDAERDRAVLALGAPGVFTLEAPASDLFCDYGVLCAAVTRHFYDVEADIDLDRMQFTPVGSVVQDRRESDTANEHWREFFGKDIDIARLSALPEKPQPAHWQKARDKMASLAHAYAQAKPRYDATRVTINKQRAAAELLAAGYSLPNPEEVGLDSSSLAEANASLARHGTFLQSVAGEMEDFEIAAAERLAAALAWHQRSAACASRERVALLITVQRHLVGLIPGLQQAQMDKEALALLLMNLPNHHDAGSVLRHAKVIADRLGAMTMRCLRTLADLPHPYAMDGSTIASRLNLYARAEDEMEGMALRAAACIDALLPLAVRVQGELCGFALEAEKTLAQRAPESLVSAPAEPAPQPAAPPKIADTANLPPPTL